MAALFLMVCSMFLALSLPRTKAINSAYGLRSNPGVASVTRNKRQSHPASTVAKFPEVPSSPVPDGEQDIVPELIDYLTPPRPPELAEPPPLSDPPGPVPTRLPDQDLDTKWRLGYDPSEILNPPADPLSLVSNSGYTTIGNVIIKIEDQDNDDLRLHHPQTTHETLANDDTASQFLGRVDDYKGFDFHAPFSNENDFRDFDDRSHFFDKRHSGRPSRGTKDNQNRRIIMYDEDEAHEDHEDEKDVEYPNADGDREDDGHAKKPGHVYTFVKTDKHDLGGRLRRFDELSESETHMQPQYQPLDETLDATQEPAASQAASERVRRQDGYGHEPHTYHNNDKRPLQEPVTSPGSLERVRRQGGHGHGVTGPVHTFQKTDKHAHFKWGVRHHVGHEFAGRR